MNVSSNPTYLGANSQLLPNGQAVYTERRVTLYPLLNGASSQPPAQGLLAFPLGLWLSPEHAYSLGQRGSNYVPLGITPPGPFFSTASQMPEPVLSPTCVQPPTQVKVVAPFTYSRYTTLCKKIFNDEVCDDKECKSIHKEEEFDKLNPSPKPPDLAFKENLCKNETLYDPITCRDCRGIQLCDCQYRFDIFCENPGCTEWHERDFLLPVEGKTHWKIKSWASSQNRFMTTEVIHVVDAGKLEGLKYENLSEDKKNEFEYYDKSLKSLRLLKKPPASSEAHPEYKTPKPAPIPVKQPSHGTQTSGQTPATSNSKPPAPPNSQHAFSEVVASQKK